jgi:hypothetical protein
MLVALARLTVTDDGTAVGPFQPGFTAFMPLRDDPDRPSAPPSTPALVLGTVLTYRHSRLSPVMARRAEWRVPLATGLRSAVMV